MFLAQASEELARGDLRQASEKGWGAAAQIVKAAAEARGWEHGRHATLYNVVRGLAEEAGDPEIRDLFGMAGELHTNFYEDFMDAGDVARHIDGVTTFMEKVEALLPGGLNGGGGS